MFVSSAWLKSRHSLYPIEHGAEIVTEAIKSSSKFISNVKKEVKSLISVEEKEKMLEQVQKLLKQGKFLKMSKCEQTDATWKSFIYNLPKGTMKWVLNSSIVTLPTKVNLKLWGKVNNKKVFLWAETDT